MGSRYDTYLLAGLDLLTESVAPIPLLKKLTSASRIGASDGLSSSSWVCGSTTVSRAIMPAVGTLVLQSEPESGCEASPKLDLQKRLS